MIDADTYIHKLAITSPLMEPVVQAAIQALRLPLGSRGLDAGCGIGLQAVLLAEAVGPAGHVTGLDLSPEFLRCTEATVRERGLSEPVAPQADSPRSAEHIDCNAFGSKKATFKLLILLSYYQYNRS